MWMELLHRIDREIDASECGNVKRLYLKQIEGIIHPQSEDMFSTLLSMCRITVADRRVLWERLTPSLLHAFRRPVNAWNEQLAVKALWSHLEATANTEEWREALYAHMDATLKPPHVSSSSAIGSPSGSACVVRAAADVDGGRVEGALICGAPLPMFSDLLRVPREGMFFVDTVLQYSAIGRAVRGSPLLAAALAEEEALLVVALIYEARLVGPRGSHWADLLRSCPRAYPTLPNFWDWSDLAELEGLDVLDDVLAKRVALTHFHNEVIGVLPHIHSAVRDACSMTWEAFLAAFSPEAVMWARATFDSRAFNLNVDGRVVLALVPVADMINHSNRSDILVRKVEGGGGDFVMQIGSALTESDVGRELWMSYGPLQSWELLQFYGFVLEENEYDVLPFPFDIPAGGDALDEWDRRRLTLLEAHALHLAERCWIPHDGRPPPALLALLRVYLADVDEFDALERNGPFTPLGATTEGRLVDTIDTTVRCIADLSGSTLEEDEQELNDMGSDPSHVNKRLAILLRVGLKRIARRTLEWCARVAVEIQNRC